MKIKVTELIPLPSEKVIVAFRIHKIDIVKVPTGRGTLQEDLVVHATIPSSTQDSEDIVFKIRGKGLATEQWIRETLFMGLTSEQITSSTASS